MPRTMSDDYGNKVTVHEHIIVRNFWEYFLLEKPTADGRALALVMGDVTEIGDVDLNELHPYVISRTKILRDLAPAAGWRWD